MFVFEFGDMGLVVKEDDQIVAYLLGFILTERALGYIHFIGVSQDRRQQGLATKLYERFFAMSASAGCTQVKAITTAANLGSIRFHKTLGFDFQGDQHSDGIPVVKDYRAPGEGRVVFIKRTD